jgi:4-amino-4-deoxy-L-arabinose transferase-like glycosyltransferase
MIVRIALSFIAIVIGAAYAWASRNSMNADGVSYLDMGDAFMRGDWSMAVNAYWSPLYAWLLGLALAVLHPSAPWEFTVAHLVNFLLYVAALASFDFLLKQFLRYNRRRTGDSTTGPAAILPEWAILAVGYALFIYFTTAFITLRLVTPDLLVSLFVYLACAMLLKIRLGNTGGTTYAGLGLVLGLGYFSKAAMFVLAFPFLLLALPAYGGARRLGRAISRTAFAVAVFAVICAPLVGAISAKQGRLSFGESGKLNYAWYVNGVPRFVHWQGGPEGNGRPSHPTRQVCKDPPVYEFASPIDGTYPPWFGPAYWYDGVRARVEPGDLARAFNLNMLIYRQLVVKTQMMLVLGAAVLLVIGWRRAVLQDIARYWVLLVPGLAGLAMYSIVTRFHDPRYIGPFLVILWLALIGGTRFRPDRWRTRAGTVIAVAVVVAQIGFVLPGADTLYPPASVARTAAAMLVDAVKGRDRTADGSAQVAGALREAGIRPGDTVAVIGDGFEQYWARLARVRIIAEVPSVRNGPDDGDERDFWKSGEPARAKAMAALRKTGAKIVVTTVTTRKRAEYLSALGWRPMGASNLYLYRLQE